MTLSLGHARLHPESLPIHPLAQGRTLPLYDHAMHWLWDHALSTPLSHDRAKPTPKQLVERAVRDSHVVELGVGAHGGLASRLRALGASTYRGLDVYDGFVALSQAAEPSFLFECAEPVSYLKAFSLPPMVMSCHLVDLLYRLDTSYGDEVAAQIAASTRPGGFTVHVGNVHGSTFQKTLETNGFETLYSFNMCIIAQKK